MTGASRGIGRQVARHYVRRGARVVITARDEEALKKVKEECEEEAKAVGESEDKACKAVAYIVGSPESPEAAQSIVDSAAELLGGGIDILFLNHGLSTQAVWTGDESQMEAASKTVQVNYLSQVYMVSAAQRHLGAKGGFNGTGTGGGADAGDGGGASVVIVNSASARSPMPSFSYYGASKAAMTAFFRSLDLEWSLRGINATVTVCTLGLVKTQRNIDKETSSLAFRLGLEPEDAALRMIKAAALKRREAKFPFVQFLIKDLIDLLPMKLKLIAMRRAMPKSHGE